MDRKRSIAGELIRVRDKERMRVAAELHDGICHELIDIGFAAKVLQQKLVKEGHLLAPGLGAIARSIAKATAHVREIAHGMNPQVEAGDGLMTALRQLALGVEDRHPVRCVFACPSPVVISDPLVSNQLYRIAQEATHNAAIHSGATQIEVKLDETTAGLHLLIRDDGCGLPAKSAYGSGLGLRAMKYRAGLIRGRLTVRNRKVGGTEVICRISRNGTREPRRKTASPPVPRPL